MRYAPRQLPHGLFGLLTACLALLPAASCYLTPTVYGSGVVMESERLVSGFHGVEVSGSAQVFVTQGAGEGLTIACDDNLLPHIHSTVTDGILTIGFERGSWSPSERAIYHINASALDSVRIRGSADLVCSSVESPTLDLHLSGSGTARIDSVTAMDVELTTSGSGNAWIGELQAESANVRISGSGEISVDEGELRTLHARTSGSGDLHIADVRTAEANLRISGSGKAQVWAEEEFSARISGSGKIGLRGSPDVNIETSGSGSVYNLTSAEY